MNQPKKTVSDLIKARADSLTRAERQLAESLLNNYPMSGLGSITIVAENANVSTPTVVRMAQKLGFSGFTEFQTQLHHEVEETISNPIAKHDRWAANAPGTHILNRFAEAIMDNLRNTLTDLQLDDFDAVTGLLGDRKRSIYLAGGRITHSLADYFFTHLQVIRPGVTLISANPSTWPHYVLNMNANDVLVLFDIRRYEQDMAKMAEVAASRGVQIVLFTDQWSSPIAKIATRTFRIQIEAPSAWDSSVITMFVIEALLEGIQSRSWDQTRDRMNTLEGLFDSAKLFRKPLQKSGNENQ